MDYRICGLFVLFFFGAQRAAAQSTTATNTSTAINGSSTTITPAPPLGSAVNNTTVTAAKLDSTASVTQSPTTVTTTPKAVNCSIGTCTGEECANTTHTSTYTSKPCTTGKCATEKVGDDTFKYRCAETSDNCGTNTVNLTCCGTIKCNTHAAYKHDITQPVDNNGASTFTAQFHLLSISIISIRLILM